MWCVNEFVSKMLAKVSAVGCGGNNLVFYSRDASKKLSESRDTAC